MLTLVHRCTLDKPAWLTYCVAANIPAKSHAPTICVRINERSCFPV